MKRIIIAVFVSIYAFTLTACSQNGSSQNDGYSASVIRFNVAQGYSHVLSQIIQAKDLLSPYLPEGVSVEWYSLNTSPEVRDSLVAGTVDISIMASMATIVAIENGLPLRIMSGHVTSTAGVYSRNQNIQTIEDLTQANRIFVNSPDSDTSMAFMAMCKDELGDARVLTDKYLAQDHEIAIIAFQASDDVDLMATNFPRSIHVMAIEGVHQVVDLTPYARKYGIGNFFVVNERFYNNNPLLLEALRKAQDDALDFMKNNPEEAAELLASLPVYVIDRGVLENEVRTNLPILEVSGYDLCAELLYEAGILTNLPKTFAELPNYQDIPG